jgi:hypothetical protein
VHVVVLLRHRQVVACEKRGRVEKG